MLFLRRFMRLWLLLAQWAVLACAASPALVVVTPNERSPAFEETIDALSAELLRGGLSRTDMAVIAVKDLHTLTQPHPKLMIALGSAPALALLEAGGKPPLLFSLLPRDSFETITNKHKPSSPVTAVYLDQPIKRQLALLRLALPKSQNIALLLGPTSRHAETRLKNAATESRFQLSIAYPDREEALHSSLQKVLPEADALLAIADPLVYNANTVQNILLTSFHARVPLLAFSPAYVKAGALLAVYSTPRQIGTQTGAIARNVLLGKALPPPQYPTDFIVHVNAAVASSLGLTLDEATLQERLRQIEKSP